MSDSALVPTSGIEPDPARQVSGPPGVELSRTRIALAPDRSPFYRPGLIYSRRSAVRPENDRWGAADSSSRLPCVKGAVSRIG